jgi:hypothetical protein
MGAECGRRWPILRLLFGIECSQARLPSFAGIAKVGLLLGVVCPYVMPANAGNRGVLCRTWKAARDGGAQPRLRLHLKGAVFSNQQGADGGCLRSGSTRGPRPQMSAKIDYRKSRYLISAAAPRSSTTTTSTSIEFNPIPDDVGVVKCQVRHSRAARARLRLPRCRLSQFEP